jgi:hypothetical protein
MISDGIDHLKRLLTLDTDRGIYLALAELNRRYGEVGPAPAEPGGRVDLAPFELKVFSQNGEDGVLAEIIRRIGTTNRFFIEFGIESGREGNCVYLADVAGWSGLFIEADDEYFSQLERKYVVQPQVTTLRAMVTPETVESLFTDAGVPAEPDVMSIDIDGADYWVWESIEAYRPRILVIEYNSAIDPRRKLVQPRDVEQWDETDYYGASLASLVSLGERKGYQLVHTELSGLNAFFVRADLADVVFPSGSDVAMRGQPNYFQRGYRHPSAGPGRKYLDLDTGNLVSAEG